MAVAGRAYTEQELIQRLSQQETSAFEYLYDQYGSALFGLAKQVLKDEVQAEDAVQEAFVRIWRSIHSYDASKGRLFTWMLNITRNLCIDMLRAAKSRKADQTIDIDQPGVAAVAPSTSLAVDHIGLRTLVDHLSPEQRLLVDLIYFQGYTQQEVADELDIPLGTVKSRIRLAMNHLRGAM